MKILSVNNNKTTFGTLYPNRKDRPVDSRLSRRERTGVAACSMLGVAASLAILAKTSKKGNFSLNPKQIIHTKIKDTYLYKAQYEEPEILAMGAGSILGGLIGGSIIDNRSTNTKAEFKSKVGEAIIQMGNITVPILSVGQCARLGDRVEKSIESNLSTNASKFKHSMAKLPKLGFMAIGLGGGMYVGNYLANILKRELLDSTVERKMKPSDLFMHWDDLCLAASFYAGEPQTTVINGVETLAPMTIGQKITFGFSRLLPIAMMVAGYQVGCKGLERSPRRKPPIQTNNPITNEIKEEKNTPVTEKTQV